MVAKQMAKRTKRLTARADIVRAKEKAGRMASLVVFKGCRQLPPPSRRRLLPES